MPEPGDLIEASSPKPGGAFGWSSPDNCRLTTATSRRRGRACGGTGRSWYVEASRQHARR